MALAWTDTWFVYGFVVKSVSSLEPAPVSVPPQLHESVVQSVHLIDVPADEEGSIPAVRLPQAQAEPTGLLFSTSAREQVQAPAARMSGHDQHMSVCRTFFFLCEYG